jgi:hypothetical protein
VPDGPGGRTCAGLADRPCRARLRRVEWMTSDGSDLGVTVAQPARTRRPTASRVAVVRPCCASSGAGARVTGDRVHRKGARRGVAHHRGMRGRPIAGRSVHADASLDTDWLPPGYRAQVGGNSAFASTPCCRDAAGHHLRHRPLGRPQKDAPDGGLQRLLRGTRALPVRAVALEGEPAVTLEPFCSRLIHVVSRHARAGS